jgi:hypothetical protein
VAIAYFWPGGTFSNCWKGTLMKYVVRIILLLAVAALAFWLWTVFFPSPEKVIRKQLTALAGDVSFTADENNLIKVAHAESVANFFTSNVVVNITIPGHEQESIVGADQITQAALGLRQYATSADVKFPDIDVAVAPDKNTATAEVTVDASISGESNAILQEVKFTLEKVDDHWLIDKVETVKVLSYNPLKMAILLPPLHFKLLTSAEFSIIRI